MRDYFIYVGRLDELKGIKLLFEAWKQMGVSAPHLFVCGTGPLEEWCNSFMKDNSDLNIEMKGFVSNKEVRRLITGAKALILPTQWYEGFPMTIVEAYSVGTPVIGSNIGNVGDLIEEGITGWKFKSNSSDALIRTVLIAKNTTISSDKIEAVFCNRYSERENVKMLEDIYQQVTLFQNGLGG